MIDKMIDPKPQSFSSKMIEKQVVSTKIIDTSPTQNYIPGTSHRSRSACLVSLALFFHTSLWHRWDEYSHSVRASQTEFAIRFARPP